MIFLAFKSVTCPPNSSYTLYPLYSLGLCEAVITTPPVQFKCLTVNERTGVGVKAVAFANSFDMFLES